MDNTSNKEQYDPGLIQVKTMPMTNAGEVPKVAPMPASPVKVAPIANNTLPSGGSILAQRITEQKNKPQRSAKKIILWVLAVLFLVVLGGGGYWYYAYGQTMLLIRQITFQVAYPFTNFKSNFDLAADVRSKNSSNESSPLEMFIPNPEHFKFALSGMQHNVGTDIEGNLQFSVDFPAESFELKNGLEYKQINRDFYFKFNQPLANNILDSIIDLSEFFAADRWLTYNWGDLENFYKEQGLSVKSFDSIKQEEIKKDQERVNQYFKEFKLNKIFNIVDAKEKKSTKDGTLKKMQLVLRDGQSSELLTMLYILNPDYLNNDELKNSQEIKDKISKDLAEKRQNNDTQLTKIEDFIQKLNIYIWVNTKTKIIQGADISSDGDVLDIDGEEIVLAGHYNFLIESEDAYVIKKPENVITVQQAYQNTIDKQRQKELDILKQYEEQNSLDSDNDGLGDMMESFYGTDPKKADTDGDGYKDGEEIDNGYNPLGPGKLDLNNIRS